jgi:fibronectin type 3 domain-containing protein
VNGSTALTRDGVTASAMTFEVSVPNGYYEVMPTLGDVGNYSYTADVILQGTQVDTVSTTGGQIETPEYVASVTNGALTIELVGAGSNGLAAIEGLSVLSLQFDMGPSNQVVATGYTPVSNFTYYSSPGYGWSYLSNDANAYDLGAISGSTAMTRDYVYGSHLTFSINLPDGWYNVTPTLGQLANYVYTYQVSLQGTVVDNFSSAANQVVSPTYLVDVTDGVLTLDFVGGNPATSDFAVIEGLAIAPATAPFQFDMGPSNNLEAGYDAITNFTWYSAALGYGWTAQTNGNMQVRSGVGNALTDDFVYGNSLTFEIDVPNGAYEVEPTLGDLGNYAHSSEVFIQGTQVDNVSTTGGFVTTPSYVATVTNGELTLGLVGDGSDGYAVIEGLVIIPLQFDMGPSNQVVAPSYTPVSNFTYYASSSSGYGWSYLSDDANTYDLGSVAGSTAMTRDYVYGSHLTFSINLPNGWYNVTPTLGQLANYVDAYQVSLQGEEVDNFSSTANEVVSPTFLADVTGGLLTLDLVGGPFAVIEGLAIAPTTAPYQFDMGPSDNLEPGYDAITNFTWYNPALGYGWTAQTNGNMQVRTGLGTPLTDDFVYGNSLTFQINVPNGAYEVEPTLGDVGNYAHSSEVFIQGTEVATVSTVAGEVTTPSYTVTVTNGELTLGLIGVGSDGFAVIEGLVIVPLQFDMGPQGQVVAPSYTPVSNFTYYSASVGYGWTSLSNNVNTYDYGMVAGSTAVTRDEIYGTSMTFEINLPNGSYNVTPTLGELGPYSHTVQVSLQGTVVGTVSTAGGQTLSPTYTASVTGGTLTMNLLGVGSDQLASIQGLAVAPSGGGPNIKLGPAPPGHGTSGANGPGPLPVASAPTAHSAPTTTSGAALAEPSSQILLIGLADSGPADEVAAPIGAQRTPPAPAGSRAHFSWPAYRLPRVNQASVLRRWPSALFGAGVLSGPL